MPKWAAIGQVADKSLADIDPDTVDSIYDETQGLPKPGPYRMNLKRLQGVTTKSNNDPMLKMVLEIAEPAGSKKARYNGYSVWYYQVSTKERASGVNALLSALLDGKPPANRKKVLEAYWSGNVVVDEDGYVQKIGTWMVPESVLIGANLKLDKDTEYGDRMAVTYNGIMPASQAPKAVAADDEDEDDDEPEDTEDEAAEDADEEVEARAAELEALTLAKLKAAAKKVGAVTTGTKDEIIDAILAVEFPEESDEDEPDEDEEADEEDEAEENEPEDEEPEGDEFDEMDRAALKKYNTAQSLGVKVTTKMTDDELRDAIRAALPEDEEEPEEDEAEEEPEPEPTPAARRGRARATAAAPSRPAAGRRKGKDDEPPF